MNRVAAFELEFKRRVEREVDPEASPSVPQPVTLVESKRVVDHRNGAVIDALRERVTDLEERLEVFEAHDQGLIVTILERLRQKAGFPVNLVESFLLMVPRDEFKKVALEKLDTWFQCCGTEVDEAHKSIEGTLLWIGRDRGRMAMLRTMDDWYQRNGARATAEVPAELMQAVGEHLSRIKLMLINNTLDLSGPYPADESTG